MKKVDLQFEWQCLRLEELWFEEVSTSGQLKTTDALQWKAMIEVDVPSAVYVSL